MTQGSPVAAVSCQVHNITKNHRIVDYVCDKRHKLSPKPGRLLSHDRGDGKTNSQYLPCVDRLTSCCFLIFLYILVHPCLTLKVTSHVSREAHLPVFLSNKLIMHESAANTVRVSLSRHDALVNTPSVPPLLMRSWHSAVHPRKMVASKSLRDKICSQLKLTCLPTWTCKNCHCYC